MGWVRGVPGGRRAERRVDELLRADRAARAGQQADERAVRRAEAARGDRPRACACEPQVLLLDEPLSALDLKLRQHMRNELRDIQRRVGITFIYITHDQGEALTMSDRIAVMNEGVIQQVGDGKTIYDQPATAFVASFVGENNPLPGTVVDGQTGSLRVIDTRFGRLRGRNPRGLQGRRQGRSCSCGRNGCGSRRAPPTRPSLQGESVAFEGNMTHVFLEGPARRTSPSRLRHNGAGIPEQGSVATVRTKPNSGWPGRKERRPVSSAPSSSSPRSSSSPSSGRWRATRAGCVTIRPTKAISSATAWCSASVHHRWSRCGPCSWSCCPISTWWWTASTRPCGRWNEADRGGLTSTRSSPSS